MQHGVGAAAHGDVECHGIEKSLARGYASGEHTFVALFIIAHGIGHNLPCRIHKQANTVLMCGQYRAVAGERQTDGFCQRVHGIGGEHARTTSAARTGTTLQFCHVFITHGRVGTLDHGRHQVGIFILPAPCLHRTATTEHGWNIQAHGSHQHTRCHFVAIGNANHGIRLMGVDHIFHRIRNNIS